MLGGGPTEGRPGGMGGGRLIAGSLGLIRCAADGFAGLCRANADPIGASAADITIITSSNSSPNIYSYGYCKCSASSSNLTLISRFSGVADVVEIYIFAKGKRIYA